MIDIYCDCASLDGIREARENPLVSGFTTNPTLMARGGVTDYEYFAKQALEIVDGLPISFEVFSDEWDDMERQARKIASWGSNVNVKIPITNTKGKSSAPLVKRLSDSGIMCNVTAVFTTKQLASIVSVIKLNTNAIISVFAGRIADTGIDPFVIMHQAVILAPPKTKILWASPREVLNIYQAEHVGCDIITVPPDMLRKYESLKGKDLTEFSLDTVKMFFNDAEKAGYKL